MMSVRLRVWVADASGISAIALARTAQAQVELEQRLPQLIAHAVDVRVVHGTDAVGKSFDRFEESVRLGSNFAVGVEFSAHDRGVSD